MNPNQEFHELNGKEWLQVPSEQCGDLDCLECYPRNPDYAADPRLVLREMVGNGYWRQTYGDGFVFKVGNFQKSDWSDNGNIPIDLILDTTGLLRDAAIKFLKERKS
jgi:hypothetical protein